MHPIHKHKYKYLHKGYDFFFATENNRHWYTIQHIGNSLYNIFMDGERVPFLTILANRKGLNIYHDRYSHYKHIPYSNIEFLDLPILEEDKEYFESESNYECEHNCHAYPSSYYHLYSKQN